MANQIWKFPIIDPSLIVFNMPEGSKILTIQMQNDKPCIWALVNPENKLEKRGFKLFGTGQSIDDDMTKMRYINTIQMHNGNLVFHLFEITDGITVW